MTGRQIFEKITYDMAFVHKAWDFEEHRELTFNSFEESLEFLTLYLVLLTTGEYNDYNETRLLEAYEKINNILKEKKCIDTHEFLSSFDKDIHYKIVKETISYSST